MDLEQFPQDWERALCVVAHPDDLEYGGASAIAAWTDAGGEVVYVLATRGEAGIDSMAPAVAATGAVGLATLDAVRDAGNRWVFPELIEQGLDPWDDVRHLAVLASPVPTHAVDVTETFDAGVESLRRHAAYLEALGGVDPGGFLRGMAEETGARFGGGLAVSFELLRL